MKYSLSDNIVSIPAIPLPIYIYLRRKVNSQDLFLRWNVNMGDWVEKGQPIASYNTKPLKFLKGIFKWTTLNATVRSPFDGIITFIGNKEFSEYPKYSNWKEFVRENHNSDGNHYDNLEVLFSIRPTDSFNSWQSLYSTYKDIVDYIYYTTDENSPQDGNSVLSPSSVLFHLEMLCYSKIIINKPRLKK
jgi:hypothetical protein